MTPLERYNADLQFAGFSPDPAQQGAARCLQRIYEEIVHQPGGNGIVDRIAFLIRSSDQTRSPVRGLYLWGEVGRGKTYLMDAFFETLPIQRKLRLHFHRFMGEVHENLKDLKEQVNPLHTVAERFSARARVLCFDEFHVADIGDAMILGGLLDALFKRGVTLVATSNVQPDELYKNGLQRARFLPAIEAIKRHTESYKLDGHQDYRLNFLEQADRYYTPFDETARHTLQQSFNHLASESTGEAVSLDVLGRRIESIRCADDIVWFDFNELCAGPRCQADYIEIARCFNTVLISDVPVLRDRDDQAKRFISLVDELYDRHVKLIVAAAAPPAKLYQGNHLSFEFQRTSSRLQEMQSLEYLARAHLP